MPSNNSGIQIGYLCGQYPGRIGWLISPGGWRKPPSWMPYALDNGAFGAWINKREWDEGAFWNLLDKARQNFAPRWIVVPDVVAEKQATLNRWAEWSPKIRDFIPGVPLAFAAQDGMTPEDVPADADVVFIGGTTEWKWRNLRAFTKAFPVVHVARVNSDRLLWMAHDAGAASCDGTGWMRGGEERLEGLERYLKMSHGADKRPQMVMEAMFQ